MEITLSSSPADKVSKMEERQKEIVAIITKIREDFKRAAELLKKIEGEMVSLYQKDVVDEGFRIDDLKERQAKTVIILESLQAEFEKLFFEIMDLETQIKERLAQKG